MAPVTMEDGSWEGGLPKETKDSLRRRYDRKTPQRLTESPTTDDTQRLTACLNQPNSKETTTSRGEKTVHNHEDLWQERHPSPTSGSTILPPPPSSSSSSCLVYNKTNNNNTNSTTTPYLKSPMRLQRRRRVTGITSGMPKNALRLALPKMLLPTACFGFVFILIGSLVTPCEAICPENCTCDDLAMIVRCENTPEIDVLPLTLNPGLQRLTMYGTEIHTLDINSMYWYQDLQHVNLSKNMIMRIMPRTFEKQDQLEELHLAQNNISDLDADMFIGLSSLIVLSLRGNVIESLDEDVFEYLMQLKDLDLSENRLENLNDKALSGLANLRVLHLHDNRLAAIPSQNLALVPDLAYLSLGGNEFLEVKEGDLQSMRTLKDLNLSGAQLGGGLTVNSFKGLSGLRKLMLENCGLKEVPTAALSPLTKLEELHIGRNMFKTLPPHSFSDNRHLYSLYVSGCLELVYVEKDVLHNNVNIKHIVITQNPQLTYIAEDAFRFLSELSYLDLHGNNIQKISENAASWKDIEKWSLEGNPIACNCSAAWLRELARAPNSSSSVKCGSPKGLSGKALQSTQLSDLACGMDPATQGLVIGIVVLVLVVIVAAAVVMMLYRHHGSCVHRLLKGHRLDRHDGTFGHHSCSHDHYQGYIMTPQKPVPVTEL